MMTSLILMRGQKNNMKIIKLMFDYLQGAIWTSDIETGEPLTGVDFVDKDDSFGIEDLITSEYENL